MAAAATDQKTDKIQEKKDADAKIIIYGLKYVDFYKRDSSYKTWDDEHEPVLNGRPLTLIQLPNGISALQSTNYPSTRVYAMAHTWYRIRISFNNIKKDIDIQCFCSNHGPRTDCETDGVRF